MTGASGAPPAMRAVVRAAVPLRKPAPVFAARSCLCGGLALCSGAVTVTLGRGELGVVCEAAVPLSPHNNEVDRIATVECATRLADILITRSPKSGPKCRPGANTVPPTQLAVPFASASCLGGVTCIFHARGNAFGRAKFSP